MRNMNDEKQTEARMTRCRTCPGKSVNKELASGEPFYYCYYFERGTWPSSGAEALKRDSWAAHAAQGHLLRALGSLAHRPASLRSPGIMLTVAAGRSEPTHGMHPKSFSQPTMHIMRPLDPHKQRQNIPNMRGGSNGRTNSPQSHWDPLVLHRALAAHATSHKKLIDPNL